MPIITKPDKFRTSQINCRIIAKRKELRPGVTRYFFDSVDVATKFGFSYYFNKQTSQNIVNFYEKFKKVFPFKIEKWQNDNGHENLGLFQQRLKQDGIKQVFSYQ